MNKFTQAFINSKTDKHHMHRYDRVYDFLIGDEKITSVLELGVLEGKSLYAWREVWPNAVVEGLDVNPDYVQKLSEDFKVHLGDSALEVPSSIKRKYDIIIDDAAHHWKNQLASFHNFYDLAEKFYVIEDIVGKHGLQMLMENLPAEVLERSEVYESKGVTRDFIHSKIVESNGRYKIMVIDKR